MPESRGRKKGQEHVRASQVKTQTITTANPSWWVPVMLGLMILGLIWIVTLYVTGGDYPIGSIGNWNLAIGLGLIMVGFIMTTQWR